MNDRIIKIVEFYKATLLKCTHSYMVDMTGNEDPSLFYIYLMKNLNNRFS